jgi:serine/threonine-protein kinase HipA
VTNPEVFIYIELQGEAVLVGRLWARTRKGRHSASFEYDADWLKHPERFALEPALQLGPGPFHTAADKSMFGAIGDSAPDRWGRMLRGGPSAAVRNRLVPCRVRCARSTTSSW